MQAYSFRNPTFLRSNKNNFSSSHFPAGGILSQPLGALGLEANADAELFSLTLSFLSLLCKKEISTPDDYCLLVVFLITDFQDT